MMLRAAAGGARRAMATSAAAAAGGPVQAAIESKLAARFTPAHLQVINESNQHNVPRGSETHFKVVVVSPDFAGMAPLARHRAVNEELSEELAQGVHALSIIAKTPEQWAKQSTVRESPKCLGGSKR